MKTMTNKVCDELASKVASAPQAHCFDCMVMTFYIGVNKDGTCNIFISHSSGTKK